MSKNAADPQVNPPRQLRSRATMERIMTAAEQLLEERPFEQITVAEISALSKSAPTAFYARFSDKNALLLEIHERFMKGAADAIAAAFALPGSEAGITEQFVSGVVSELIHVYSANHNLLRSVLLADNPLMYDRAAELARTVSTTLAARIQERVPLEERDTLSRDIDFAIRSALAILQQRLLYRDREPSRFPLESDELHDRLTSLVVSACRTAAD